MKITGFWLISALLVVTSNLYAASKNDQNQYFLEQLTPAEADWVNQREPVTYTYDPDWAPFEWQSESGIHTGIISDLYSLLSIKTGLEFVPQHTKTWSEAVKLVRNGKADMFSAITVTNERKQYLNFTTKDIYSYPAVLLTQFDDKQVYLELEKDAKNKRIAIVKDSGLGAYVRESHPGLKFVEVDSTQQGFEAVISGEADLFAINTISARYFIDKHYRGELKIVTKLDYIYHLKIAVHKDKPEEIVAVLDKALGAISEKEKTAIFKKWTRVEKTDDLNWEIIIEISVVFLMILIFMGWHNFNLKRRINEKTQELDKLANTDPLTGANNRRSLDVDFQSEAKRANRYQRKMALLYIDLNNFKSVNDNYGHDLGDLILKYVASGIMSSLRDTERLYRVGGDEFCILVPEVSGKEQMAHLVSRLDDLVHRIGYACNPDVDIGCSIGTSIFPDNGTKLSMLMTAADKNMYQDKLHNKNSD